MAKKEAPKTENTEASESAQTSSTVSESAEPGKGAQDQADQPTATDPTAVAEQAESSETPPAQPAPEKAETTPQEPGETAGRQEMVELPDFSGMLAEAAEGSIELLRDVELNVKIELGRSEMTIDQILKLGSGSVVELNKLAGDPVDVLVNEQLIARGEVLVLNENFCVRINEIIPGLSERIVQE